MKKKTKRPSVASKLQSPFSKHLRHFVGYLQATSKAAHTVKSYEIDLKGFHDFATAKAPRKALATGALSLSLLEEYHEELKRRGLKTNTRRRILMTLRRFVRFLHARNVLKTDWDMRLPTPQKVERVPRVADWKDLHARIQGLPQTTFLERRNRALFWTLLETGAQVAEVAKLRLRDFERHGGEALVRIQGKRARGVPVSTALAQAVESIYAEGAMLTPNAFPGCNKVGPLPMAISPRGIELLIRDYAGRLGGKDLVPRAFRHAYVVHAWEEGLSRDEIQKRLGLLSQYSFRMYEPIFKSKSGTTSTSGTPKSGSVSR